MHVYCEIHYFFPHGAPKCIEYYRAAGIAYSALSDPLSRLTGGTERKESETGSGSGKEEGRDARSDGEKWRGEGEG